MQVFDSSLWLAALLTDSAAPDALLQEVLDGNREVAIDSYIHEEVTRNIERADRPRAVRDDAQRTFNDTVADLDNVVFPTYREIGEMNVETVRARPEVTLLHEILGIQSKDVPIVVFAHELIHSGLTDACTIYTVDRAFARFDPSAFDRQGITLEGAALD